MNYSGKLHGKPLQEGEQVWLFTPVINPQKGKKFSCFWSGPWRIQARISDVLFKIRTDGSWNKERVDFIASVDRLKRYNVNPDLPPINMRLNLADVTLADEFVEQGAAPDELPQFNAPRQFITIRHPTGDTPRILDGSLPGPPDGRGDDREPVEFIHLPEEETDEPGLPAQELAELPSEPAEDMEDLDDREDQRSIPADAEGEITPAIVVQPVETDSDAMETVILAAEAAAAAPTETTTRLPPPKLTRQSKNEAKSKIKILALPFAKVTREARKPKLVRPPLPLPRPSRPLLLGDEPTAGPSRGLARKTCHDLSKWASALKRRPDLTGPKSEKTAPIKIAAPDNPEETPLDAGRTGFVPHRAVDEREPGAVDEREPLMLPEIPSGPPETGTKRSVSLESLPTTSGRDDHYSTDVNAQSYRKVVKARKADDVTRHDPHRTRAESRMNVESSPSSPGQRPEAQLPDGSRSAPSDQRKGKGKKSSPQ